ncbi:pyridoxal-phosphate dependent enzyme [Polaribacter sp.]|nr:pyridoxal-phosphate dependent enzyme [Polaribacter sp.]
MIFFIFIGMKDFDIQKPSKNQQIYLPVLEEKRVELFIKREDLIHPFVSGNKFRKLKYNLHAAKEQQKEILLTFGGAFSNHIVATAIAARLSGFKSIGIIRGDELGKDLAKTLASNSTLREAHNNGMIFKFVSRETYRRKSERVFQDQLKETFGDFYLIPEGGTNNLAIKGCEEILTKEDSKFDYICCAVGTGGTISGIINAAELHQKVIGFPALKGAFLQDEIQKFTASENWQLATSYHFGGYAKYNEELIHFMNQFSKENKILLDPIYTGKMLFGILDLIAKNYFPSNSKIVAIHTGGLQGIEGVNEKLKKKNQELIYI